MRLLIPIQRSPRVEHGAERDRRGPRKNRKEAARRSNRRDRSNPLRSRRVAAAAAAAATRGSVWGERNATVFESEAAI